MVEWDSKYETGIPAVDDQHKELFKLVGYFAEKGFRNSTFICDAGIDRA